MPSPSYANRVGCTSIARGRRASSASPVVRGEATGRTTAVSNDAESAVSPSSEAPAPSTYMQPAQVVECRRHATVSGALNVGMKDHTTKEIRVDAQGIVKEGDEEEWIEVKRRRSTRFKGKQGCAPVDSSSKFRAADVKILLFLYNVSKVTTEKDIEDYIMEKTNIVVAPEKVHMKYSKEYDSYKIYIPRSRLNLFEKDDFWPNGILIFRRYVIFEARQDYSVTGKKRVGKRQDGCEK